MDPFPPSRAEAVRRARERGEGLGEKVLPPRHAAPASAGRRQVLLQPDGEQHRDAAARPVVGEPDAGHAAAARREAHALLARSLRDRPEQGARLPDDAPAEPDAACERLREPARSARRDPEGSRHARVPGQRREHQEPSERELRARAARAVHDGRGQLHRTRRARGRARVHRLDQRRTRPTSSTRRSTTSARRRSSDAPVLSTARTSSTRSSRSR